MLAKTNNIENLLNVPTEDLITFINWKSEKGFENEADNAFIVICYRFRKVLSEKCEIIAAGKGLSNADALVIAENTFKRFYKYSSNFDISRHKDCNKGLKYYLFRIAQNECTKLYCLKNGIGVSPYTGDEEVIEDFPEVPDDYSLGKINKNQLLDEWKIIEMALNRHSWKHKVIFLTYKFHYKDGYKLPRFLLDKLRKLLNLPQNTVQAYKKEIFDAVNDYLKIYGNQQK